MRAMRNHDTMGHPYIDDERMVDRYVAGRLPSEEEALFEEHLFACTECLEQVEAGEELRRGLHAVATEDAARSAMARQLGTLSWIAWLRSRRPAQLAGLAALVLVFLLLPAVVLWQQMELHRFEDTSRQIAVGTGLAEPTGDFQVVPLGVVRDAEGVPEIRLDPEKSAILFSLELPTVTAVGYRVTLQNAQGETLWTGEDVEPTLYDTLLVAVPSSFLAPGGYRLMAEGRTPAGFEPAGKIRFRVMSSE